MLYHRELMYTRGGTEAEAWASCSASMAITLGRSYIFIAEKVEPSHLSATGFAFRLEGGSVFRNIGFVILTVEFMRL